MANAEINDLTNKVTPLSTDEVEIQATAGGASNKATLANVSKAITITKSQVSDFSDGDYATAAQGATADTASQPGHTHPTTDLTATGGTSTSYLRKDNTWATPTNTTYTEISEAEITAGTASTLRTITGRRAGFIKARANHTGTQTASTISDFDTEVSNNTDVAANTTHRGTTTGNPHNVTKSDVGLGNVDNTSDATKNSTSATLTNKNLTSYTNTFPAMVQSGIGTQITATGNYTVTGVGFEPRIIQIFANLNQAAAGTANASSSTGYYDRIAGTQGSVSTHAGNGNFGGTSSSTLVINNQAPIGTTRCAATISATGSDGFTLNVSTYSALPTNWIWVAYI